MPAPHAPSCPRCGYDQSGIVVTWDRAGSCPLDGVCSECGLAFLWRDVLVPARTVPRWSFEHAIARRPSRLLATLATLVRPWRFWRDLRMSHPIRWRRLAVMLLVCLAAAHLIASAAAAWATHDMATTSWVNRGGQIVMTGPDYSLGTWVQPEVLLAALLPLRTFSVGAMVGHPAVLFPAQQAAMAFLLWVLSDTRRMAKVRPSHIGRALAYALAGALLPCALMAVVAWLPSVATLAVSVFMFVGWGVLLLVVSYLLWTIFFWWLVIRRYMMLPSAGLVMTVSYCVAWFAAGVLWFAAAVFSRGF